MDRPTAGGGLQQRSPAVMELGTIGGKHTLTDNRYDRFNKLCMRQVMLAEHSSYAIGGEAPYFAMPQTVEELSELLQVSKLYGMEVLVFGMGTNILFPDRPKADTLYISLKRLSELSASGGRWFASAGLPLSVLALAGLWSGSDDFHFTYLMPGSLGAGVYMNVKYHDVQMSDRLAAVHYIDCSDPALPLRKLAVADCEYSYKKSIFQQHPWIIVGGEFELPEPEGEAIKQRAEMLERYRQEADSLSSLASFYAFFTKEASLIPACSGGLPAPMQQIDDYRNGMRHFTHPSCGSFFKNYYPAGISIGAIVDRLGLKGTEHGGACISPYHGNMLLNMKQATAADILYLKELISEQIEREYGFVPEPEVVIVEGED
ncbi:UDP-N-acetylmuramate dehydrogenase [Paenibacillus sp. SYP-B4298]|uniref:UDP-N-acetylmuramate dehydrogenase n=1 Tax=Paenibacillus sp. SYP-B4298 TaxID=2996034 RepID=UPI0022DD1882|nr:FAD-binding protein [Paenibacillus sp. SYP-B4298]